MVEEKDSRTSMLGNRYRYANRNFRSARRLMDSMLISKSLRGLETSPLNLTRSEGAREETASRIHIKMK